MRTASIPSKYVFRSQIRFESKYYLNENSFYSLQIERLDSKCYPLERVADVFNPSIFKRQFCKSTPRSVQYFQSSDVANAAEHSQAFVSRAQAESLNLLVRKNDILITGFGTIGNTRLVSKYQDGVCYANNVCRVRVKSSSKVGFIYAFLSSKYGYSQLNKNASGSVVRYIEAPGIRRTLIPDFPDEFQKKVDDLIQESARLREQATDALNKAHELVETFIGMEDFSAPNHISVQSILKSHNNRFEGSYFISDNRKLYNYITTKFTYKLLKNYTSEIFRPGIFKREYVKKGVTFLGGSNIMMAIPSSDKQLSFRQVSRMPELIIKKGWILVTCGGTIGNTVYVDDQLAKCAVSQHVIRIVPKSDDISGFLYGYLSSRIGYKLITLFTYGSVIPSVEPHHLDLIPIPEFDSGTMSEIDSLVKEYSSKNEKAKELEVAAVIMVEQEIEKWNK